MSKLALVTPEGVPMVDDKPPTPTPEAEDLPLHVIAARQHAKDSTKKDTNK